MRCTAVNRTNIASSAILQMTEKKTLRFKNKTHTHINISSSSLQRHGNTKTVILLDTQLVQLFLRAADIP